MTYSLNSSLHPFDSRRDLALPGDFDQTLTFCVEYFIQKLQEGIEKKGFATVALSGGSTPKAIFKQLASPSYSSRLNWTKIYFFFGDERSVAPDHPESNYKMALEMALEPLSVPKEHIFRMVAEQDGDKNAEHYAILISEKVPEGQFDLVTLGMGDDGHTASLFPHTKALSIEDRWVTMNDVPQKNTQRMTLTYPILNRAHHLCFFVLGKAKEKMVREVLQGDYQPLEHPSQKIGTETSKALWILDQDAAAQLEL